jgi:hypothetical protein
MTNALLDFSNLSRREKEIFCGIKSSNLTVIASQRAMARELHDIYYLGDGVTRDKAKVKKYADMGGIVDSDIESTRTQYVYSAFGWFTTFRILLIGARKFTENVIGSSTTVLTQYAGALRVGGLSYAVELLWDLGLMIPKAVFFPEGILEKQASKMERLRNILAKDNRANRMRNAVLWLAVNGTCFYVTDGMSALLNVIGFSADLLNECYNYQVDFNEHNDFLTKIKNRFNQQPRDPHVSAVLIDVQNAINSKIDEVKSNRRFAVSMSGSLLVGITLALVTPFTAMGAIVLAATIAVTFVQKIAGFFVSAEVPALQPVSSVNASTGDEVKPSISSSYGLYHLHGLVAPASESLALAPVDERIDVNQDIRINQVMQGPAVEQAPSACRIF